MVSNSHFYRQNSPKGSRLILSPLIRRIFKDSFLDSVKGIYDSSLRNEKSIRNLPRFTEYHTTLDHYSVSFPDAQSFLSMRDEIWHNQSYFFECRTKRPFIIDCGSNIGLSVLYFKQLFPNSNILAFEPDPILCKYLNQNVRANGLTEIEILPKVSGLLTLHYTFYLTVQMEEGFRPVQMGFPLRQ